MKKLVFVPIELLEERYSQQWYRWFQDYFIQNDYEVTYILPNSGIGATIQQGQFLDVINTNKFKAEQLQMICDLFNEKKIDYETTFLFMDAWFPGLEMLAYMRNALNIPFKIVGMLHAGTWDPYDFLTQKGMRIWAQPLEYSWFKIMDKICVATQFHKNLIKDVLYDSRRHTTFETDRIARKIEVTGFPIYPEFVKATKKENLIVFPHRLAPEKNPNLFKHLMEKYNFKKEFDEPWELLFTKEVCKNKKEYYELLNRAKIAVSFADQETFGIAMLESVLCGCYPIVPNKLSYLDLYPFEFTIKQVQKLTDELQVHLVFEKIKDIIEDQTWYANQLKQLQERVKKLGTEAIPNILRCCHE